MNKIVRHIVEFLKAISQAFFFHDARFGALILLLFLIFSPYSFAFGMLGSLIGYVSSARESTPRIVRDAGLIPINGFFFGIAIINVYQPSLPVLACLMLGALCIPALTKAAFEVMQHWKLSPYIIPYIAAVWLVCLATRSAGFDLQQLPAGAPEALANLPALHPEWSPAARAAWSVFLGMGRLVFVPDAIFGFYVWALITLFSPRRGIYFLLGTALATALTLALSREPSHWEYGLTNYSAGLVGLGLATSLERLNYRRILLFCAFSALITMALEETFSPQQLPILSLPSVLTLWLAMLSRGPRVSLSWAPSPSQASPAARPQMILPLPVPARSSQEEPEKVA